MNNEHAYKLVVYRDSRIIGYVFVADISLCDYPAIKNECARIFRTHHRHIAFRLAD
jgi:hypothetical protein